MMLSTKALGQVVDACERTIENLADVADDASAEPLRREVEELRDEARAELERRAPA
ncbi:MAG: hypothetical protein ICV64_03565 [Thermoleophilia bacterium]|nr:hypothetical protein [Thermoleophilia bacterium]